MKMIRDFSSEYVIKVSNELMLDSEINKMLYYNKERDKDIYSLPDLENPIKELKNKKVYINKRIDDILQEADISVFVNLYKDGQFTEYRNSSPKIKHLEIEIGVICHNDCRFILNGLRDIAVFKRIQKILSTNNKLRGIGMPKIEQPYQIRNIPYEYMGYACIYSLEYFEGMNVFY